MKRRSPGFTLIEIMIAVAIIGLLASIAIPSFFNARRTAQKNTCMSHLRQISGSKDQYALSYGGATPGAVADLVPEFIYREPKCPGGGSYTIGGLAEDPICSLGREGHTI